jgi:hypothetical protein
MSRSSRCPHCGGAELYTRRVPTSAHTAILRGLGRFPGFAKLDVVLCADCGHCSLFAEPHARDRVRRARGWQRWDGVPRCSKCGYDRRATPARCPECGTPAAGK